MYSFITVVQWEGKSPIPSYVTGTFLRNGPGRISFGSDQFRNALFLRNGPGRISFGLDQFRNALIFTVLRY